MTQDPRPLSRRAIRAVLRRLPTRANRFLGRRWEPLYWRTFFRTRGMEWPWDYEARLDPTARLNEFLILERLADLPDPVSVLDVGAGPLTELGKVIPGRRLEITATDALGDAYRKLLAREGLTAPVPTLACAGEDLLEHFGPDRFDVAYSRNALDHAADVARIIENMIAVTRPGGFVLLKHLQREGERRDYTMLHSWNFDIDDGAPVVFDRRTHIDLKRAFGHAGEIEAFRRNEWVCVVIRKAR